MHRRLFRRALIACFGLLVVKLLFAVFSPRLNGPKGTEVGIQPSESAPAAPQFDPEEFVLGLAEPRLFFEGLGGVARKFLPDENGDSLLEQLRSLSLLEEGRVDSRLAPLPRLRPHFADKLIVVTAGVGVDPWRLKREAFVAENCPINNCYLMEDLTELPPGVQRPDVVLYKLPTGYLNVLSQHRTSDEVWIVWQLESPVSAPMADFHLDQMPNWTASYRSQSTVVTPYGKFVSSTQLDLYRLRQLSLPMTSERHPAAGKTKLIAWFVSNCRSSNQRENYVDELRKYAQVDVYGNCGDMQCAKFDQNCVNMLRRDYKFYLAFENSNCRQYVTEKLYENAYSNDVVPVVMGAHPDDYRAVAPPHSYIHVDDFESPRHLADYLKLLDQNDTLYNEYFAWKGSGRFINTKFWCRLCAMLHARDRTNYVHTYTDLETWWKKDQCLTAGGRYGASWRTKQNTTTNRYNEKMTSR